MIEVETDIEAIEIEMIEETIEVIEEGITIVDQEMVVIALKDASTVNNKDILLETVQNVNFFIKIARQPREFNRDRDQGDRYNRGGRDRDFKGGNDRRDYEKIVVKKTTVIAKAKVEVEARAMTERRNLEREAKAIDFDNVQEHCFNQIYL